MPPPDDDSKRPPFPEFGAADAARPDYQVVNPEIQGILRRLGALIGDKMPEGWGFTLLMFDHGEKTGLPGHDAMFYLSSVDRGDMILALKEFIKKQEH